MPGAKGPVVKVESAGGVMTATLADLENRNALGGALIRELREAIAAANADPTVRALVVTNEGSTFCAGANLKERSAASSGSGSEPGMGGLEALLHEIQSSPTPVLGRIAGHAVGGGMGLAAALDVSIAADDALFGFTEVRLGVAPAIISVICLPKMRPAEAMEAFLRGQRFPAQRAVELGLLNRAVPRDRLDAAVDELIADLRKGGPQALGVAKSLVHRIPRLGQEEAFAWTGKLSLELFAGPEAAEGMKAFLGKRRPSWAAAGGAAESES